MQLMEDISRVPRTINAYCILHNICIMINDQIDNEVEPEDDDDDDNPPTPVTGVMQIRESIRQLLFKVRKCGQNNSIFM